MIKVALSMNVCKVYIPRLLHALTAWMLYLSILWSSLETNAVGAAV